MELKVPILIAEIGCNHMGDIEVAKRMISVAANYCNVNYVKFQKRNIKELLSIEEYNAPHPNANNSYGKNYGEHREFLEFSIDQHKELKEFCDSIGITYSSSVWDLSSAIEIASLKPKFIKIPSASNTDTSMIQWLLENYNGEIHLSLGMTTREEETRIFDLFKGAKRLDDLVLYACTSGYPVPFEDLHLLEITRLIETYGNFIKAVGFSGHHNGISIDIATQVLGAEYIERHFTLDRTSKGTDHAASLEPEGLRKLQRNLHATALSLTTKPQDILDIEIPQRKKLKRHV